MDFNYTRLFVVSKLDEIGLPEECYVYEHNAGDIAKLNDSEDGQEKLLQMIAERVRSKSNSRLIGNVRNQVGQERTVRPRVPESQSLKEQNCGMLF